VAAIPTQIRKPVQLCVPKDVFSKEWSIEQQRNLHNVIYISKLTVLLLWQCQYSSKLTAVTFNNSDVHSVTIQRYIHIEVNSFIVMAVSIQQ
jgi:hypothetical protein